MEKNLKPKVTVQPTPEERKAAIEGIAPHGIAAEQPAEQTEREGGLVNITGVGTPGIPSVRPGETPADDARKEQRKGEDNNRPDTL